MVSLNLNPDEAALVTRILDLYLTELKKAAADPARADLKSELAQEEASLRDILQQLAGLAAA